MTKEPRFPKQQPKGICRGCLCKIVEPRRRTWCSQACKDRNDPWHVKLIVSKRCNWHCEMCAKDCSWKANETHADKKPRAPTHAETQIGFLYDPIAYHAHPLYREYSSAYHNWCREIPKPEYDHIIPHSEGGNFTPDNIRLLCRSCHLKRTAEWRKQKAQLKKALL